MPTYRLELLVRPAQGVTADDLLAQALTNIEPQVGGTAVAVPGGLVSVVVRFEADIDRQARGWATVARRGASGSADITALTVGRGRNHRRVVLAIP